MAQDSIYVIGPVAAFNESYDKYVAKGFVNRGAVRYSLDGSLVLIEESANIFEPEDLEQEGVMTFTQSEVRQYLLDNKDEWEDGDII